MDAAGFSKVSNDTFGVYPWDAFGPIIVEAVGECITEDEERALLEGEGLLRESGETEALAGLGTGDARECTGWMGDGCESAE